MSCRIKTSLIERLWCLVLLGRDRSNVIQVGIPKGCAFFTYNLLFKQFLAYCERIFSQLIDKNLIKAQRAKNH